MKEAYITIAGTNYRYGEDFLEKGMELKLVKEPDNEYDKEAIKIELTGLGVIGYVANSYKTVIGECMSAGRLYDKIGDTATAVVMYKTIKGIVCKVTFDKAKKSHR